MCFTVSVHSETHVFETDTGAMFEDSSLYTPYYHVTGFVYPELPLITNEDPKHFQMMHWGLIPRWVKDLQGANDLRSKTLNARSETAFEKPSFRDAIVKRRGLLPVNGFVEWRDEATAKIPHFVKSSANEVFTLGCIWEQWLNKSDGELFNTFSILTTQANELMSYVHNTKQRMPVVIAKGDRDTWLGDNDKEVISNLTRPLTDGLLTAYPLSRDVSKIKVNTTMPDLIQRVEPN
ncbi:MAG: SOS response-associated peptidase [Ignavibacteria bacterium]|nr:SOS response-associated peptidase [Ignavibacteria bacterium]